MLNASWLCCAWCLSFACVYFSEVRFRGWACLSSRGLELLSHTHLWRVSSLASTQIPWLALHSLPDCYRLRGRRSLELSICCLVVFITLLKLKPSFLLVTSGVGVEPCTPASATCLPTSCSSATSLSILRSLLATHLHRTSDSPTVLLLCQRLPRTFEY